MQDEPQNTNESVSDVAVPTPEQSASGITNAQLNEVLKARAVVEQILRDLDEQGHLKRIQETLNIYTSQIAPTVEIARRMQEQARLVLMPYQTNIEELSNRLIREAAQFMPLFDRAKEVVSAAQVVMRVWQDEAVSLTEKAWQALKPALEYQKWKEEHEEASNALLSVGFVIAPSMSEMLLKRVVQHHKAGKQKAVVQTVMRYYKNSRYSKLKGTVSGWQDNLFFHHRLPTMKDALDAHIHGKFTLSVPALLTQVEGVISDFVHAAGLSLDPHKSKDMKEALSHASQIGRRTIVIHEALDKTFDAIYQSIDFKDSKLIGKRKLNRHSVLHGRQIGHTTEVNSLRAFLILDAVSALLCIDRNGRLRRKT